MRTHWIGLLLLLATAGCGQTLVVEVPDAPPNPFGELQVPIDGEEEPRVECEFMTVLIDYSRHGDVGVATRVARAMADEFESVGTRVTSRRKDAYWSLMILASENATKNGYIFSAMLSARNMNEGYDPGVTVFRRDGEAEIDAVPEVIDGKVATMYHGLSYGPHEALEEQARLYVQAAYAAVFPYAEQLCDQESRDRARERSLDAQLPKPPEPL